MPIQRDITVDRYVLDILMPDLIGHDRSPSAFVVFLYLWRHSAGVGHPEIRASLREIAEGTGLSKRGVQEALSVLSRRRLIAVSRKGITDVPVYTVKRAWQRGA